MHRDSQSMISFFKELIKKQLIDIDIRNVAHRQQLYASLIDMLEIVLDKNSNYSLAYKKEKYELLKTAINEVESEIKLLSKVDNSGDKSPIIKEKKKSFFEKKLPIKIILYSLFAIILSTAIYSHFSDNKQNTQSNYTLPKEFLADKELYELVTVRGKGKAEFLESDGKNAIVYITQKSDTDELQSLDIIFRGEFAKYLKTKKESIVIKLQIKQLSNKSPKLRLLVLGLGATKHSEITITDQKTNQLFVVTNSIKKNSPITNVLFRLMVMPQEDLTDTDHKLEIQKITIDKI